MKRHQSLLEDFYFSTWYQSKRNPNPKIPHLLLLLASKFSFLSSTIAFPPLHHFPKCRHPLRSSIVLPQVLPPSQFSIRHISIHLVVPLPSKTSIRHLSPSLYQVLPPPKRVSIYCRTPPRSPSGAATSSPSAATLQKSLHLLSHPSKGPIKCSHSKKKATTIDTLKRQILR